MATLVYLGVEEKYFANLYYERQSGTNQYEQARFKSATITATLKNQGNASAGKFYLKYYVDGVYQGDVVESGTPTSYDFHGYVDGDSQTNQAVQPPSNNDGTGGYGSTLL